jgi:hypothetical protein
VRAGAYMVIAVSRAHARACLRLGCDHFESRFLRCGALAAARVANNAAEFREQCLETVNEGIVVQHARMDLSQRRFGALGGRHRVPVRFGRLILIGEQQRTPSLPQVPLDVLGKHAQKDMGPEDGRAPDKRCFRVMSSAGIAHDMSSGLWKCHG